MKKCLSQHSVLRTRDFTFTRVPTLLVWSSLAAEEAGKLSHSRSLEQLAVIDLAIDLILCSAPRGALK